MKQQWEELRVKALNTEHPRWRRIISTLLIILMTVTVAAVFWDHYFHNGNTSCLTGYFYFLILWLAAQIVVIGHLYFSEKTPAIARSSTKMLICFGNFWFILYLFNIQSCG